MSDVKIWSSYWPGTKDWAGEPFYLDLRKLWKWHVRAPDVWMPGANTLGILIPTHPVATAPRTPNYIIVGTKKGRASKGSANLHLGCAVWVVREDFLPDNSKLCLTSDFALGCQFAVVNATINVVTEQPYRNCCAYHDAPLFNYPATSIPKLQPRLGSGFSHSWLKWRVSTWPSLSSSK